MSLAEAETQGGAAVGTGAPVGEHGVREGEHRRGVLEDTDHAPSLNRNRNHFTGRSRENIYHATVLQEHI